MDSFIQLPPDSTGKKLHTLQDTVGANTVQTQVFSLGGGNSVSNRQYVDERGQAYTRFAEGSPSMDAFGNLRVSAATVLGAYEYTNGDMADLFTDIIAGNGSITYVPQASHTVLAVDSLATSSASRTTNRYHYYQPGVGNLIIITLALGDSGRANNIREWGYADEENGLLFRVTGTTLQVVLRSNTSGTVVEEIIDQANWNGDKLNGTGTSGMTIDLTKANFYWIDYAWLGVGPVRFGVLAPDGSRWVCHTFENPNNRIGAYMRSGSLPLHFHNYNTGVTGGTSEMKSICAAIYAESSTSYTFWRFADIERLTPVTVTTDTPVLSMRVKAGSRVGVYPECLCVHVTGGAVKLNIVDDATLTGATWAINGEGSAEGDIAATGISGGSKFKTFYVPAGVSNLPIGQFYETNDEGYHRLADDSDSYTFTLVATKLDGTTVTVGASLQYRELR
jgi:hypothetical protein